MTFNCSRSNSPECKKFKRKEEKIHKKVKCRQQHHQRPLRNRPKRAWRRSLWLWVNFAAFRLDYVRRNLDLTPCAPASVSISRFLAVSCHAPSTFALVRHLPQKRFSSSFIVTWNRKLIAFASAFRNFLPVNRLNCSHTVAVAWKFLLPRQLPWSEKLKRLSEEHLTL